MAGSPVTSAASVHRPIANDRSTSECSGRIASASRVERLEHLLGLRLTRDDPAVDLDDAAVGDDVGSAPALDHRRVHRRSPHERMLDVGQDLLDPEEEPRHRGDRAHAEVRGGAVCGRAASGRGDPGAAAFGEGDVQLRRLADDGRVLVEVAAFAAGPSCRAGRRAPRRPRGAGRACRRARRRSGGSPRRRRARPRWHPSCPPRPVRSAGPSTTSAPNGGCRHVEGSPAGTTSRWPFHASAGRRRSRSARPRSGAPPRRGRSRACAEVLEDLHRDRGHGVLGAARVLARRRDEPARETRAPRRGPPARRRLERPPPLPWRRMYRSDVRARLRAASIRVPRPRRVRATGSPPCCCPSSSGPARAHPADRAPLAAPRRDLVPGRPRARGGRGPGRDGAARDAGGARAARPTRSRCSGALAPVHTFVSAILIVPFVGVVSGVPPRSRPARPRSREVLAYPLDELTAAETTVEWPRDGHVYRGFAYPMRDGNTVWGATATIAAPADRAIVRSRP